MFSHRLVCRGVALVVVGCAVAWAPAQQPAAEVFAVVDGDEIYTVLEPDAIPAIRQPEFVQGDQAKAQMQPGEHVMGVVIDGQARAYSTWQLDHHEIVNDQIGGTAFAVTW